jgi:hypothetical protein
MDWNKWLSIGDRQNDCATGFYAYYTGGDGLCSYATKAAAINNAIKSGARNVFSPTGFVVWNTAMEEDK